MLTTILLLAEYEQVARRVQLIDLLPSSEAKHAKGITTATDIPGQN